MVPNKSVLDNLNTISSIAAFEGAQTRIFETPALINIDNMPFIVCVLPVPG